MLGAGPGLAVWLPDQAKQKPEELEDGLWSFLATVAVPLWACPSLESLLQPVCCDFSYVEQEAHACF